MSVVAVFQSYKLKWMWHSFYWDKATLNSSRTTIDLILTNDLQRISQFGVIEIAISYHNLIYTMKKTALAKDENHKYSSLRSFKSFNENRYN